MQVSICSAGPGLQLLIFKLAAKIVLGGNSHLSLSEIFSPVMNSWYDHKIIIVLGMT